MKTPALVNVEAIAKALGPTADTQRKITIRSRTVEGHLFTGRVLANELEVVVEEGECKNDR